MNKSVGRLLGATGGLGLLLGRHVRTQGAIIFAYHDIGFDPTNSTDYYISPSQLRAQLTWAIEWGLHFVDLLTLTNMVASGDSLDGLAAIAFDDSLVGVHHHAMPILAEMGLPATIFVVSDALGTSPPWWKGAARVMTQPELLEGVEAGFRIASHTRTHPVLSALDGPALHREVAESRHALEDLIGGSVDLFAYPYGDSDERVRSVVAQAGYRAGFSFLNGRITSGLDIYNLPRLNMWNGQGRARLAYHLARPSWSWPSGA